MKKISQLLLTSLVFLISLQTGLVQADESMFDKAKSGAESLWGKTKETTAELAESASKKASEISENPEEAGEAAWEKMKEVGAATVEGARKGAEKVKEYINSSDCSASNPFCNKGEE
ncbi:hypothetical protein J9B83_05760 [Marinomonas sp. A79]|uniref:Late embryogenesis abundant protein n=1 Tax=Marinomonas vulgaris TaxID=2823372 RepID=A0ABS5HBV9_9GAMM|nr:hypothetical protein [Marinomonas vulgaris]MBR7888444.1 hypothetical protein [Marinomonas vulgaris]